MSYSGTVRCSHCYGAGHNRRKCPDLTSNLLRNYKAQILRIEKVTNMTDQEFVYTYGSHSFKDRQWYVDFHARSAEDYRKDYMKRTKIDPATGEKVTNKKAKAERMKDVTCGYCNENGHTRRSCQNVKNDYAIFCAQTIEIRKAWYKKVKDSGMGLGSLVTGQFTGYNEHNQYGTYRLTGLVTSINFNLVDAHFPDPAAVITQTNSQMRSDLSGHYSGLRLPNLTADKCLYPDSSGLKMSPSRIVPKMPIGWLSPETFTPIKEAFKTDKPRRSIYGRNDHNDDPRFEWIAVHRANLKLPLNAHPRK